MSKYKRGDLVQAWIDEDPFSDGNWRDAIVMNDESDGNQFFLVSFDHHPALVATSRLVRSRPRKVRRMMQAYVDNGSSLHHGMYVVAQENDVLHADMQKCGEPFEMEFEVPA